MTLPVFIINLARSTDRRRAMEDQLAAAGIAATFLEAVDGCGLSRKQIALYDERTRLRRHATGLLPGEIGCYLSHLAAIGTIADGTHERAIVLKDDVTLGEPFARLCARLEQMEKLPDYVRLLASTPRRHRGVRDLGEGLSLVLYRKGPVGTQAYLLSRRGAARLRDRALPIVMPIDNLLDQYWLHGLRPYAITPFVLGQPRSQSTIEGRAGRRSAEQSLAGGMRRRWFKLGDSIARRLFDLRNPA